MLTAKKKMQKGWEITMSETDRLTLNAGDRLIVAAGGARQVWIVSAVNNQVVKYFDENGRYGQMSQMHLLEMRRRKQVSIEPGNSRLS